MAAPRVSRRYALAGAVGVASAAALTAATPRSATAVQAVRAVPPVPFRLGVASGDPLPDGVVLWTRLVRDPLDPRSVPAQVVPVDWQVATDERFRRAVRTGTAAARAELAHAVHVDLRGLEPGREYFYRFRALGELSPVGRTRTAPAPDSDPRRLRLGVASCQNYQHGYWPALTGLADEDLDAVLFLGDYIYETDPSHGFPDRVHTTPDRPGRNQLATLDDYRNRHAQYKGDPALRAAHAACPWIATWDDHETENDYAGLVDEAGDTGDLRQTPERFAAQRANAYQAYYEHMPVRAVLRPGASALRIYRRFEFGRLVRLNVLDTRQYRTAQPVPPPAGHTEPAGVSNVDGTLTGAEQERWLVDGLIGSPARWNVIAQQVMMARARILDPAPGGSTEVNLDRWDGYAPQRARLLRLMSDARVANPVVLSGDIHSTWFNELHVDFDDAGSAPVAVEFVGTSISSDFRVERDALIKATNPQLNPHVRYFDGLRRGYLRCDVRPDTWRTDLRVVQTTDVPEAPVQTQASFTAESGTPRLAPS